MYEFTYNGVVVPYKRVRVKRVGKKLRFHNEQSYTDFKHRFAAFTQKFIPEPFPKHTPITLSLNFGMGPKAKSTKLQHFTKRPDIDNLAKSIMDAFNEVVYHDDSNVVELCVLTEFSEHPFVQVSVGVYNGSY